MRVYQRHDMAAHYTAAHNDYLQLAAEGGLLVGIPAIWVFVVLCRSIRRRFLEQTDDAETYWIRIGAVTGLVAIALQEVVDFSLQIPGNALLFGVLCAIAIHSPSHRAAPST
jgi:O-antigen ligase